jgi:Spy/CpxP family protein refolding chaperone
VEPVEPAAEPAPGRAPEPRREPAREPVTERQPAPIEPEPEPEPEPERERLPPPEHEAPAGEERAPRFDRVADELQLRADQRLAFLELQRRHFEQVRRTRAALEGVRARLAQEFLSGSADRARVEGLLAEAKGHQNELDSLLARMLLESQQILTPEQQRRFSFLVLQRLRAEGPGRLGPRGGGEAPLRRRPLMRRPPNG